MMAEPQPQAFTAEQMPKHVAIIMDGNGRWAKQQGKMRILDIKLVLRPSAAQSVMPPATIFNP